MALSILMSLAFIQNLSEVNLHFIYQLMILILLYTAYQQENRGITEQVLNLTCLKNII